MTDRTTVQDYREALNNAVAENNELAKEIKRLKAALEAA